MFNKESVYVIFVMCITLEHMKYCKFSSSFMLRKNRSKGDNFFAFILLEVDVRPNARTCQNYLF